MRTLKRIAGILAGGLAAAGAAAAVSFLLDRGDTVWTPGGFRITVAGAGAALSFLAWLLFSFLWARGKRNPEKAASRIGTVLNAAGFGLLPGLAVWKAFEQGTASAAGIRVFDPLPAVPFLTSGGCFAAARIEMLLAVFGFAGMVIWLVIRREELKGKADLLWIALCIWGLARAFTENLRAAHPLSAGSVNLAQVLFLLLADLPLLVWTRRLAQTQKGTMFIIPQWIAVLSCETIIVLSACGLVSAGSGIGDLAVAAGCTLLSMLLILLAGKDCRE